MSIEAMTWVFRHSTAEGGPRLVLLALADTAHDDGSESYPSVDTLAMKARLSRRSVQYALRKLEADGHISRDGTSRHGTTIYRLNLGGGANIAPVQSDVSGGRNLAHGGAQPTAPEPKRTTTEPSTSSFTEKRFEPERTSQVSLGEQLVAREEIRAAPRVKHNGREVPRMLVAEAVRALEHFNTSTGRQCQPFTGRGKPSESLSRIIGAMLDWPAVRIEWRRMIDRSLADPWWDGPASTGVIFGPKVVEQSLARATSLERPAPSTRGLTPSGRAIAKLLAAGD